MPLSWNEIRHRPEPFPSERQRVEFFFALYEQLTAPLVAAAETKRVRKNSHLENTQP